MVNDNLILTYNEGEGLTVDHFEILNGRLNVFFREGDKMAVKDLGKVVGDTGPQGPQGEKGNTGPQGPKGEKGDNGISPTFSINAEGHLLADYDNPVTG